MTALSCVRAVLKGGLEGRAGIVTSFRKDPSSSSFQSRELLILLCLLFLRRRGMPFSVLPDCSWKIMLRMGCVLMLPAPATQGSL